MKRAVVGTAGAIALMLALAGCTPGSDAASGSAASGKVVTDPAQIGKATVKVLNTYSDNTSPIDRWYTQIVKTFEKKYPNVTIKTESVADPSSTLKLRLADAATPDIVPANNGWNGIGDFSAENLIANLDGYAKAYGWDKTIPASLYKHGLVTTDGKNIGEGSAFGVPINQGGLITVFYDRALMKKLGVAVPTTMSDFEADAAKAKAAGITPIQLGVQDGWSALPMLNALQASLAKGNGVADFVFSKGSGNAENTALTEASQKYVDWMKAGYYPKNFVGTASGDASQSFVNGNGLFYFWYSGFLPFTDQAQEDKFGMFTMPRADSAPVTSVASTSQNFSIAEKSKVKDAAALFLNFMASKDAGQIAIDNGLIPAYGNYSANTGSPMMNDGLKVLSQVTKSNGYVPYFNWTTPQMSGVMTKNVALLLNGSLPPAGVTSGAQTEYNTFRATKK